MTFLFLCLLWLICFVMFVKKLREAKDVQNNKQLIKVKEKGTHQWFETTIEAVYSVAVKAYVAKLKKEKKDKEAS